jgi:radical S-adenosyl methionine domain-containing protein 2
MQNSYLILDEYMRFLNCEDGKKEPSESILEVGVEKALEKAGFDDRMFITRNGVYDWSKSSPCADKALEW